MKVTINGITYEGTEEEIRHIVEDPPQLPVLNQPVEFPDNSGREVHEWPMRIYPWPNEVPHYPFPDSTPSPYTWPNSTPTNPNEWPWRNWDGSPRVTCSALNELFGEL